MSEIASDTQPKGSWFTVWMGGAAMTLLAVLFAMLAFLPPLFSHPDRPMPAEEYLRIISELLSVVLLPGAAIALVGAALLIGIMCLVERRAPSTLVIWLLAGLLVASPVALFPWIMAMGLEHGPKRPPSGTLVLAAVLLLYACGLAGAATAFRIRHGSWRR